MNLAGFFILTMTLTTFGLSLAPQAFANECNVLLYNISLEDSGRPSLSKLSQLSEVPDGKVEIKLERNSSQRITRIQIAQDAQMTRSGPAINAESLLKALLFNEIPGTVQVEIVQTLSLGEGITVSAIKWQPNSWDSEWDLSIQARQILSQIPSYTKFSSLETVEFDGEELNTSISSSAKVNEVLSGGVLIGRQRSIIQRPAPTKQPWYKFWK